MTSILWSFGNSSMDEFGRLRLLYKEGVPVTMSFTFSPFFSLAIDLSFCSFISSFFFAAANHGMAVVGDADRGLRLGLAGKKMEWNTMKQCPPAILVGWAQNTGGGEPRRFVHELCGPRWWRSEGEWVRLLLPPYFFSSQASHPSRACENCTVYIITNSVVMMKGESLSPHKWNKTEWFQQCP